MTIITQLLLALIALVHIYIFVFECFLWEVRGPKVFTSFPKDLFPKTKALAFNQGVYNLFLAAGLIWVFFIENVIWQKNIALFFLSCVAVAGIAGALTERKIIFVQTLPAVIAIISILV